MSNVMSGQISIGSSSPPALGQNKHVNIENNAPVRNTINNTRRIHKYSPHLRYRSSTENGPLHPAGIALLAEGGQAMNQEIGALGLARAALPGDDDALVDPLP